MSLKALFAILVFAAPALAAEPTDPVRDVMAVTENNWATDPADYQALFTEDRLSRLCVPPRRVGPPCRGELVTAHLKI